MFHIEFRYLKDGIGSLADPGLLFSLTDGHPQFKKPQRFPIVDSGEIDALNAHGLGHFQLGIEKIRAVADAQRVIQDEKGR